MKNKQLLSLLFWIGCAITSFSAMAQNTCVAIDRPIDLNEHYKIDLRDNYIKSAEEGRKQKINFAYHFRYSSDTSTYVIKEALDSILMRTLLKDMYEDIILPKVRADQKCKDSLCITALKIRYGMKNERIVFLYQPTYLVPAECSSSSCRLQLRHISKQDFYAYNAKSESFNIVNREEVKNDTANYDDHIRVKQHRGSTKFLPMDRRASWLGDSQSIIFSFQEILEIYHQNYSSETNGNRYCNKIDIHNAAEFYQKGNWPSDMLRRGRIKHTSFISSRDWDKGKSSKVILLNQMVSVNGNVGNLAHLCPPSCNELSYTIQN